MLEVNGWTIITGASGSMGAAATEALAVQGKPVIMACRNPEKAESVRNRILSRIPEAVLEIRELDLSSLASVRRFAGEIEPESVSGLFNNAGTISRGYSLTEDGLENTMAVNYFGPWLLTNLLLPCMRADARIVNMVSLTCRFAHIQVSSLQPAESEFRQLKTYARSKRAFLSFSQELARRHPRFRVHVADPGVVASGMIDLGRWFDPLADALFKPFCKKPEAGVRPALRALSSDIPSIRYFVGRGSRDMPNRYIDPALDAGIWDATEERILRKK